MSEHLTINISQQNINRQTIRTSFRKKRRSLSKQQQLQHAHSLRNHLNHFPLLRRAKRIGVYISNDGEIDLTPTIEWIWRAGKHCFLPVLNKKKPGHLFFSPYAARQKLVKNRFAIPEPRYSIRKMYHARHLDVILMPLVGFDRTGNRIGMGGGFYDRSLAYLDIKGSHQRPKLVGVAHSIQEADSLPFQAWDISMQVIVTEQEVIITSRANKPPL